MNIYIFFPFFFINGIFVQHYEVSKKPRNHREGNTISQSEKRTIAKGSDLLMKMTQYAAVAVEVNAGEMHQLQLLPHLHSLSILLIPLLEISPGTIKTRLIIISIWCMQTSHVTSPRMKLSFWIHFIFFFL